MFKTEFKIFECKASMYFRKNVFYLLIQIFFFVFKYCLYWRVGLFPR